MNFKEAHIYLKSKNKLVLKASFFSELIFLLFLSSEDIDYLSSSPYFISIVSRDNSVQSFSLKDYKKAFDNLEGQI